MIQLYSQHRKGASHFIICRVTGTKKLIITPAGFIHWDNSERSRRSENFVHYVNNRYAEKMGLHNRGVKPDTQTHIGVIGVFRHTQMPAILVELAFINSPLTNPDVPILKNK